MQTGDIMALQTTIKSQLKTFEYEKNAKVRTVERDGEIWWVAKDVCDVLGIANARMAVSRLDEDERDTVSLADGNRGNPNITIINEAGLYNLILRSEKPEAKKFKRWVTHEVIPQIRKTGKFQVPGFEIPVFVKRFNENWDRIERGYFSVISELYIRLHGLLEQSGYRMPNKGKKGKEMRPDVSVGRTFAKWLDENYPELSERHKHYSHYFPDQEIEVEARQYENLLLPQFIEFVEKVWIPECAEKYFKERDPKALDYLPKLLMRPNAPKLLN